LLTACTYKGIATTVHHWGHADGVVGVRVQTYRRMYCLQNNTVTFNDNENVMLNVEQLVQTYLACGCDESNINNRFLQSDSNCKKYHIVAV
jgi:hypothetical protein